MLDNRNEHNRYMKGLGEIGKSIGGFQYLCNNLENIIGELIKTLGNDLGDICD
jgi:hypothetical protein